MEKESKTLLYLCLRYLFLFVLVLFSNFVYYIFTPLTVYAVLGILKLFYSASLVNLGAPTILLNNSSIILADACIAGAAYVLLIILNLTTPMPVKTRIKALSFSLIAFLIINILRITLFSALFINSFLIFNLVHILFWYVLSTIIVVLIWFLEVKLFLLKEIPIYSDIRLIYREIKK